VADDVSVIIDALGCTEKAEALHAGLAGPEEGLTDALSYHLAQVIDPVGAALLRGAEIAKDTVVPQEWVVHTVAREFGTADHLAAAVNPVGVANGAPERAKVGDRVAWDTTIFEALDSQPTAATVRTAAAAPLGPDRTQRSFEPTEKTHKLSPAMKGLCEQANQRSRTSSLFLAIKTMN
jgi:hypothetical protein